MSSTHRDNEVENVQMQTMQMRLNTLNIIRRQLKECRVFVQFKFLYVMFSRVIVLIVYTVKGYLNMCMMVRMRLSTLFNDNDHNYNIDNDVSIEAIISKALSCKLVF